MFQSILTIRTAARATRGLRAGILAGALAMLPAVASAGIFTFTIPSGTTAGSPGLPVSASATFVTGVNTLEISLQNLEANPKSVIQNLSDLSFALDGGLTAVGSSLTSSSGQEITINGDGTFTLGGVVSTGWKLDSGSAFHLNDLAAGAAGPAHLIIGPPDSANVYSAAEGSIAGNGPHNPFLNQTALFTLNVPGMTADTAVTAATFSFGTTSGTDVPGGGGGGGGGGPVPEPGTIGMLVGMACFSLPLFGRVRRSIR